MRFRTRLAFVSTSLLSLYGCAEDQPTHPTEPSSWVAALTAAQCDHFAVDGKTQICHRTSSTKHPFTIIRVSESACVNAHVAHAGDYVAVGDPDCNGGGCLPSGAPCDETLPCCEGATCTDGYCQAEGCDSTEMCDAGFADAWTAGYSVGLEALYSECQRDATMPPCGADGCANGASCALLCDADEAYWVGYGNGLAAGYDTGFVESCPGN